MQLESLGAAQSLPSGAWRFCTRRQPQKTGKLVTLKITGGDAVAEVLRNRLLSTDLYIVAVPGVGHHLHRARAIHQCTVLL